MAIEPQRKTYTSRALTLSYLEWGAAAEATGAPCLVLVHGGLEHAHAWDRIAPELAGPWRVIAVDMRGHGDSAWSPGGDYSIFDFASDLAALFAAAKIEDATLVGHSLGGAAACAFAALYPEAVARLCVIEGLRPASKSALLEDDERIAAIRQWSDKAIAAPRRKRTYRDIAAAADRMREHDPQLPPHLAEYLAAKGTIAVEGGVAWKYDERVRTGSLTTELAPPPSRFWDRIACPVLLVYGAESWAKNPAEDGRLAHFRDARVEVVAGAGHNVHHHQPEAFLAVLEGFLTEAPSSRPS